MSDIFTLNASHIAFVPTAPTNTQAAADKQTVIAQQNGTTNAPAAAPANVAYSSPTGVQPAGSPPPPVASTTNGGPGTAPTINNQNSTFQYTAKTPGYLDYSDPNTAGGIWSGDRYEKEWKPLVGSTMADAAKADQVINYLTNYTGTDAADSRVPHEFPPHEIQPPGRASPSPQTRQSSLQCPQCSVQQARRNPRQRE